MQPTVNPTAVDVLMRLDMATLIASLKAKDWGLVRLNDGSTLSPNELHVVMYSTRADLDAACSLHLHAVEHAEAMNRHTQRAYALFVKYARAKSDTVTDVLPRMSEPDREEFMGLAWVLEVNDVA